jgi:ParB family chromosome partitioning protein
MMSKKLSTKERALLATADSDPSPSTPQAAHVVVESVDDVIVRSPQRPRTGLGISSAQFFKNDETEAENDRLRSQLKDAEQTVETAKQIAETARNDLNILAAEWEGVLPARKLDPRTIKASKYANRHDKSFDGAEFSELKAEIESAGGNVQAIKVRPIPGSEPQGYEVVFGHRRHRACLELGIDVLATVESIDDKALFMEMDRENRQRADLRPYEQGVMYVRALDDGLFSSNRKLAEDLGVDVGGVGKLVTLAKLPGDVLNAFESPLDIQFAWGSLLAASIQKDPDAVLHRAREVAKMKPKPKASVVFHMLTSTGVDSVYPLASKPTVLSGKAGSKAKVSYDPKKKQLGVSIVGVSAARLAELEQLIKKFLDK